MWDHPAVDLLLRIGAAVGAIVVAGGILIAVNAGRLQASSDDDLPTPSSSYATEPLPTIEPEPPPVDTSAADAVPATPASRVDPTWLASTSAATGIPARALAAYASAELTLRAEQPSCGLGWNTIAALGDIESGHGTHDGAVLGVDGYPVPAIIGPALNGQGYGAIRDTDSGAFDGDSVWDHAVGPLQFIPDTWFRWSADGNGDGVADPNQIDDAALAAARYLCASGSLTAPDGWRRAVFSYNHLDTYVDRVAAVANAYAAAARPAS